MTWSKLTDSDWESIKNFFPPTARVGRPPTCRRKSIDGILWVLYHDAPWRNLPKEFGAWRTIYGLCQAWIANGTLGQVIAKLEFDIPAGKGELIAQGNADAARVRQAEAAPVGAVVDDAVPAEAAQDESVSVG
ncbi:MAG: transposase [Planctomycetaceae bacterium]|nr:MAG: transposase [Planctomycetaceae bacterium]